MQFSADDLLVLLQGFQIPIDAAIFKQSRVNSASILDGSLDLLNKMALGLSDTGFIALKIELKAMQTKFASACESLDELEVHSSCLS